MRPSKTINKLRALGYKVFVTRKRPLSSYPWRLCLEEGDELTKFQLEQLRRGPWSGAGEAGIAAGLTFAPTGGRTIVKIEAPEGTHGATGESRCSHLDNINKKMGLEIALNRAIKQMGVEL